ncbi:hypothetical protein [Paractinoplanes brasiliensis]|uniref:Uncharacterized protein n=1 Tax=Paractinoplanes brasiliensis TaxID=52695 RepID=A0A4R6K0E5_9ACTN|nr:hypothetical protein [Actinoplanes brasiliensis]TDO41682.1 hypothetical protein C8E87_5419 [Actinoplanes brasiliensis]GID27030.1 hypothetical protein Abr02nite_20130 [Actinoplanes brasiliensis]
MNTETTLKDALAAEADALGALDNPWPGFERRERRHRTRRRMAAAGVAAVLAGAAGVQAGVIPLPGWAPGITVAGFTTVLDQGPTRGSLAGDKAFLEDVRRHFKDVEDPGETWRIADRSKIRFVYAADVGDRRLVLALVPLRFGFLEDQALIWYDGNAGDPAAELVESGRVDGGETVVTYSQRSADAPGVLVVVAPHGSTVAISEGFKYSAEGRIDHEPDEVQAAGTGLAELVMPPAPAPTDTKVTVTSGADVLYSGTVGGGWASNSDYRPDEFPAATVTRALTGRTFDRATMTRWANSALQDARLPSADTALTVRWTGQVNGQPAALLTIQPRGGGVLAYAFHGTGDSYRQDLRLLLPAANAERRPLAWRMRADGSDDRTDRVIVVAPPGATRLTLQQGTAAPVELTPDPTGAAMASVPPAQEAHVTAYGENGSEVATTPVPLFEGDSGGLPGDTPKTRIIG